MMVCHSGQGTCKKWWFVQAQKEAGGTTLLACALGVSRSASLAIAAIKETEAVDLMTAYCIVKRARPEVRPHPVLWQSLCERYQENVPWATMFRAVCLP